MTQWQALLLSLAIEIPVVSILATALRWQARGQLARLALAALAGTALTHPVVWYGILGLAPVLGTIAATALLELVAVTAETAVYRSAGRLAGGRALVLSLAANAASFLTGLVLVYWA